MNTEKVIINAIKTRKVLVVNYKNQPENRIIEPHTLGYKNGNIRLSAYQTEGYSTSEETTNWKIFLIQYLKIFEEKGSFNIRIKEGYNPNPSHKTFDNIIVKVQ